MMPLVFGITVTAFVLGGAGLLLAGRRVDGATRRSRWIKFAVYAAIVHTVLGAAWLGPLPFAVLLSTIGAAGASEVRRAVSTFTPPQRGLVLLLYGVVAAGLVAFGLTSTPGSATYVYIVVATFDGFSQVTGQLFGRRRLAAKVSPGKTVEGCIGGAAAGLGLSVLLRGLIASTTLHALGTGAALIAAALCGDLLASSLKRAAGVKDFGRMLPGHGGVLDRFDSLLLAAPVWLLFFR